MKILLVEDNNDLSANMLEYLQSYQHIIDIAADGLRGLQLAKTNDYDVIVLDLTLPRMDGLTVCETLRNQEHIDTPILMLTARDTLDDKLQGFSSGADDYLVKPFSLHEMHARMNALYARSRGKTVKRQFQVDDLILDEKTCTVSRAGHKIELTPTDRKILQLLMEKSPEVVRREIIEREIWGELPPDSDVLRSHIHSLRNAIDKPFKQPLLKTVRGIGFCLESSDEI